MDSAGPQPVEVARLLDIERRFPGPPVVDALRGCSLTIRQGDSVAIMGPSGSGKSTLLGILGLLDTPSAGSYRLAGRDVSRLSDRERASVRAHTIGFVFQAFHLVRWRTARENVAMGLLYRGGSRRHDDLVDEALERVGLSHRATSLARVLSGGECQRTAIARAIVGRPDLVLCDEPTGNLDSDNARRVLDVLVRLNNEGHTLAIITHDEQVAAHATRRVFIRDGTLDDRVEA